MAITPQLIHDGERNVVIKFHVTDNAGADYVDALLLDASTLSPIPAKLNLVYIQSTAIGFGAILNNDGTPDSHLVTLPEGETVLDHSAINGLINDAISPTGNILISTTGAAAGTNMTIYMELIKIGVG